MSERYVITCDVCGKDIEKTGYYTFRERYEFKYRFPDAQFFVFQRDKYPDMDMCESCFSKFRDFVNQEKTGAN